MRAILLTPFVLAGLAGQEKPSDLYASAIAKYVAGDDVRWLRAAVRQ